MAIEHGYILGEALALYPNDLAARDAEYSHRAKEGLRTTGVNTDWVYDYDLRTFAERANNRMVSAD